MFLLSLILILIIVWLFKIHKKLIILINFISTKKLFKFLVELLTIGPYKLPQTDLHPLPISLFGTKRTNPTIIDIEPIGRTRNMIVNTLKDSKMNLEYVAVKLRLGGGWVKT